MHNWCSLVRLPIGWEWIPLTLHVLPAEAFGRARHREEGVPYEGWCTLVRGGWCTLECGGRCALVRCGRCTLECCGKCTLMHCGGCTLECCG